MHLIVNRRRLNLIIYACDHANDAELQKQLVIIKSYSTISRKLKFRMALLTKCLSVSFKKLLRVNFHLCVFLSVFLRAYCCVYVRVSGCFSIPTTWGRSFDIMEPLGPQKSDKKFCNSCTSAQSVLVIISKRHIEPYSCFSSSVPSS